MDLTSFYRQMATFAQWKTTLSQHLQHSQQWFEDHSFPSPTARHCLQQAQALLDNDTFTVACVGEFSRGKTELINALLFSEYGKRLLPSTPGRTTMCPTEIFYDPQSEPGSVHLLPIETRRTTTSLNNFKRIPKNWIKLQFNPADPESVDRAMSTISQIKRVDASDARAMGFDPQQLSPSTDGLLAVPRWRHALINLDHPLLRHGLRILDTPGLNALGNEPELTLSTLQQANAVIFLLAADAGLSYSDITIWQDHLQGLRATQQHGSTITLLNKVDTLWNDLGDPEQTEQSIHQVREATARMLAQPMEQVLAISAKQGLLARAQQDDELLQRSNLPRLELLLTQQLIQSQQFVAQQRAITDAVQMMQATRGQLQAQLFQSDQELERLQKQLSNPTELQAQIRQLRSNVRQRHQQYHRQHLDLRSYQRQIDQCGQQLRAPMAAIQLEGLITSTHQQMVKSWSFVGLAKAIDEFFQQLQHKFNNIDREAKTANEFLLGIYQRTQYTDGQITAQQHGFQLRVHRQRLQQLEQQARQFRRSLGTIFNSKQRVIGRFINSLVQEVRSMNTALQADINLWAKEALAPISHETQYQKSLLDQQMLRITNLNQHQTGQENRLQELQTLIAQYEYALVGLDRILNEMDLNRETLPYKKHNSRAAPTRAALLSR
ncbi:hypothetical protein G8770_20085 [Aestuariicella hydrocarbonica]|uniref:Dynamin N-terminal domain-containing protein n=1 Tax=Pseudomaricurvus hydrocarbonicus TaxID=1470433 RepID=A0A9E5MPA5_9GAMM|nr:dynamin family protein [Aestuariicella hydrocarbonica]NHO67852.1 hypothetical protein [Aestuariicella hydrocarbonica]